MKIFFAFFFIIAALVLSAGAQEKRTITDLAGRSVTLPKTLKRIAIIHGDPEYMLWRIAPELMVNTDTYFSPKNDRVFPQPLMRPADLDFLRALPSTGMYSNVNREDIATLKPDVVLTLSRDPNLDKEEKLFGVPVVATSKDGMDMFEASFRLVGVLTGKEKLANEIADYWHKGITEVSSQTEKIPASKRVKVYFVGSSSLTATLGNKSQQASLVRLAGGINFYDVHPIPKALEEAESVPTSMEEILAWDPDVIVAPTLVNRDQIYADAQWKNLKAVKEKRVYVTLQHECTDHFQSLLSLLWLAQQFYPGQIKGDLNQKTHELYRYLYHCEITDEQIAQERKP